MWSAFQNVKIPYKYFKIIIFLHSVAATNPRSLRQVCVITPLAEGVHQREQVRVSLAPSCCELPRWRHRHYILSSGNGRPGKHLQSCRAVHFLFQYRVLGIGQSNQRKQDIHAGYLSVISSIFINLVFFPFLYLQQYHQIEIKSRLTIRKKSKRNQCAHPLNALLEWQVLKSLPRSQFPLTINVYTLYLGIN